MRVLYLISSQDMGVGGHFWSMRTLVEAIAGYVDCAVVNVGRSTAAALDGLEVPRSDVLWRPPWVAAPLGRVDKIVERFKPDVLHAFDRRSLMFARPISLRRRIPVLLTKCGGPNPPGYFPRLHDLALFSQENYDFFSADRRFRGTRLHLIPNRVSEIAQDPDKIALLREGLPPGAVVFLRIARMVPEHESSSLQTLALVNALRRRGAPAVFVQVGMARDAGTLARLEAAAGPEDRLFTQREMVSRASALIDGADWVVGTGRSLMEAASRGKPLLVPLADAPQPALLGPNNFDRLFGSNFSARSRVPGFRLDENLNSILEAMDSKERLDEIGRFSRRMFEEHFSIATVVPRYLALYDAVGSQARQRLFDTALETGRILRRR